uniref:Uncharacterized protein n=1 Tax=Avena sativa TaxID=4498 RepID=A0ACD5YYD0_AVESA
MAGKYSFAVHNSVSVYGGILPVAEGHDGPEAILAENELVKPQTWHKFNSEGDAASVSVPSACCHRMDVFREYNDENAMEPSMLLESSTEDITANSCGEDSSKMLDCCRKFLSKPPSLRCYVLQEPALHISTDLYVVCQADSRLIVYCTEIVDGRLLPNCNYNPLRLHQDMNTVIAHDDSEDCYAMEDSYPRYSIVRSLTSIYAVSYKPDDTSCEFELSRPSSDSLKTSRPAGVCFAVVLNVGHRIVAVSHALEVFWFVPPRSSRFHAGNRHAPADRWKHCKTRRPDLVVNDRRVDLSGYVVLDADTFIVSDKETCRCFLLNMKVREWKDVLPDVKSRTLLFHDPLVYGRQRLNGRSIYVGGYIYSCTAKGLVAYDFHGGILDDAISLPFPWRKPTWERERMCLDLVGAADGAVIFCVVQGGYFSSPHGKDVHITIVQVKTTRTSVGKFRPVSIDHVDIATCFIPREDGVVSTRSCFSVKH